MVRLLLLVAAVVGLVSGCLGGSTAHSAAAGGSAPGTSTSSARPHRRAPGGVILGNVEVEHGNIEGNWWVPVSGAPVWIRGRTAGGKRFAHRYTADVNGDFRLTVPAGRYVVTVRPPGSVIQHRSIVVRVGRTTDAWFEVFAT
jgi:hypothetical protein